MAVCRYCHSLIAEAAKQCFTCGWDWHDGSQPIQRGSVQWERLGVEAGQRYVIELCESHGGDRHIHFRADDEAPSDPDYMTETVSVDGARLIERGLRDCVNDLRLRNGDSLRFGPNGEWITTSSFVRLCEREIPTWRGDTSALLSHRAACDAASDYGRSMGFAPFTVIDAVLLDENGSPIWHVMLEFDDRDDDSIGFDPMELVRVDATTGHASSTLSL